MEPAFFWTLPTGSKAGRAINVMSPPKHEFLPEPRVWSWGQVAAWFGRGEQWFRNHRPGLEAAGFPPRDDLLGGWDADACKMWLDSRSGLLAPHQGDDQWMEALR